MKQKMGPVVIYSAGVVDWGPRGAFSSVGRATDF